MLWHFAYGAGGGGDGGPDRFPYIVDHNRAASSRWNLLSLLFMPALFSIVGLCFRQKAGVFFFHSPPIPMPVVQPKKNEKDNTAIP